MALIAMLMQGLAGVGHGIDTDNIIIIFTCIIVHNTHQSELDCIDGGEHLFCARLSVRVANVDLQRLDEGGLAVECLFEKGGQHRCLLGGLLS